MCDAILYNDVNGLIDWSICRNGAEISISNRYSFFGKINNVFLTNCIIIINCITVWMPELRMTLSS